MFESSTPRWFAMNTFFAVILLVSSLTLNPVILGIFKIEKDVSLFLLSIVVVHSYHATLVSRWIIIFTSLAIDVFTGMISHSFVHGLSAVLTFVIGGARWVSQWRRPVVEIKACWSFEVSSTILTIYPIIFSLIVNLPAIMTYVAASVFFFGVIPL